jgi:hypothetical protein
MYFVEFDTRNLQLKKIELVPLHMRLFQLNYPSPEDRQWLLDTFNRICAAWHTRLELSDHHTFNVVLPGRRLQQ